MNTYTKVVTPPFEKLSNFRDIGGLKTKEGTFMKSGVLFRSDELSKMTTQDCALLHDLNIKVICDLRTSKEYHKKSPPHSVIKAMKRLHIPLHTHDINRKKLLSFLFSKTGEADFEQFRTNYYHHIAFESTAQIKEIITILSHEENQPALIHCRAGKDRTGFIAAIIQLLVGVPYESVAQEYLKTNQFYESHMNKLIKVMRWVTLFRVSRERMKFMLMAHQTDLDKVYEAIIHHYGSVEDYLCKGCGIEPNIITKLKHQLLK